jgi:hypothetical protein
MITSNAADPAIPGPGPSIQFGPAHPGLGFETSSHDTSKLANKMEKLKAGMWDGIC